MSGVEVDRNALTPGARTIRRARSARGALALPLVVVLAGCGDHSPARSTTSTALRAVATRPTAASSAPELAERYRRFTNGTARTFVLNEHGPTALAAGAGYAAWVMGDRLVVRAPHTAPVTVEQHLPRGIDQLAIGRDAHGVPKVILGSSGGTTGLLSLPADGSASPRPLPFSAPGSADAAPGLSNGTVTFTRAERIGGQERHTVRSASIDATTSTTLWRGARKTTVTATAPTVDGAAFVTSDDAYEYGSSHTLHLVERGAPPTALESAVSGESAPADFGALQTTTSGTTFTATRWTDDQRTHPWDVATYRAPSGELVSRHHPPSSDEGAWGVDVPDGRIHTDMGRGERGDEPGDGALVFERSGARR